jgi:hypothetical protein
MVKKEIIKQIGMLDYDHQKRVLDFVRVLAVTNPKRVQDIAVKTVEGASNSKSVVSLQQLLGEQIRKQNPDK